MWHAISEEKVLEKLGTSSDGLGAEEAENRLKIHGKNSFGEKKKKNFFKEFLLQMTDSMVLILLAAAAVSVGVSILSGEGEFLDAIIILLIVVVNAVTGVVQEFKAESALESLKKMNSPTAQVIRDGCEKTVDTENIVPGDVIVLNTGDFVPADARVIRAVSFTTDESALTGESKEVSKNAEMDYGEDVTEAKNMVWAHTVVTGGRAKVVAVETGMNTRTGRVAGMIINGETPQTPLQSRLKKTGQSLGIAALFICGLIFVMGIIRRQPPLEMFMMSVSLAVAAIPEGLPAIVTVMLAIGVQKMAKKKALIRKLPAVETLGSATVICTDKTGTLTKNEMTVTDFYGDRGRLSELFCLCNDNRGATEKALVRAATDFGISKDMLDAKNPRVDEIPFSSSRKLMTTVHKCGDRFKVVTKGAPEMVLPLCSVGEGKKKEILSKNIEFAGSGKRVIAVACKEVSALSGQYEQNLVFEGLAAMKDPPREGVSRAVSDCKKAGIKVIMITGDQKETALSVARETGISADGNMAVSGKEIDLMNDDDLVKSTKTCRVFYRVAPDHKMRIVCALQRQGEVVAMTGDGVNDSPALKTADIGCAMGKCGTDVAKGAADMVLADDNFTTIAEAVRQGRGIYANIRKAVRFLLSSNIGEIFTIFTAIFFGKESPLTAIQLLWMNLVTDSLPAIALGLQPPDKDIMNKKPVKKDKSIFADGLGLVILTEGIMIGLIATLSYIVGERIFGSEALGRTMSFCTLSMSQLFHAFAVQSEHSIFSGKTGKNKFMIFAFLICMIMQMSVVVFPAMRIMFKTCELSAIQWWVVLLMSSLPLVISETEKLLSLKSKNVGGSKIKKKA